MSAVKEPCHNCCAVFSPTLKAQLMRWFRLKAVVGALALAGTALAPANLNAQTRATFTVTVEDLSGAALPGATVTDSAGRLLGRTDADGRIDLSCAAPCRLRVEAAGFEGSNLLLSAGTTLRLKPAAGTERVTVTAYRTPLGSLESPVTTRLLTQQALNTTAAVTLDDTVRQLPGVELFRRSSSLVANPSSQIGRASCRERE